MHARRVIHPIQFSVRLWCGSRSKLQRMRRGRQRSSSRCRRSRLRNRKQIGARTMQRLQQRRAPHHSSSTCSTCSRSTRQLKQNFHHRLAVRRKSQHGFGSAIGGGRGRVRHIQQRLRITRVQQHCGAGAAHTGCCHAQRAPFSYAMLCRRRLRCRQQPTRLQRQRCRCHLQQRVGRVAISTALHQRCAPGAPIRSRVSRSGCVRAVNQGIDRVARAHCIRFALEQQHAAAVGHNAAHGQPGARQRSAVHRLRAHIHRTHQRCIRCAALQRLQRQLQRMQAGKLLSRHGAAGAANAKLAVQAVGGHVRHQAQRCGSHRPRLQLLARSFKACAGRHCQLHIIQKFAEAQVQAEAAGLCITAHAHKHSRAFKRHRRHLRQRLMRQLQRQQLLRTGLLQVFGRKRRTLQRQLDGAHCARSRGHCRTGRSLQRAPEVLHIRAIPRAHGHGHNRAALRPRQRHAAPALGALHRRALLHQQLRIVAAKAKSIDGCAPHTACLPVSRLHCRRQHRAVQRRVKCIQMQDAGLHAGLHRLQHFDQAGHARHGQQVAQVRLHRAQRHALGSAEYFCATLNLGGIAQRGAGGMALNQVYVLRAQAAAAEGSLHRAHLPGRGWHQHAGAAPVVGQARAADHAQNVAAIRQRIFQALQHHQRCAFGRHQPVRRCVQRPALPAAAQRLQRGEAGMDGEPVHARHAARQHYIRAPGRQPVTRKLDGIQRRRTGGIHHEAAACKLQRLAQQLHRQPGHKAV